MVLIPSAIRFFVVVVSENNSWLELYFALYCIPRDFYCCLITHGSSSSVSSLCEHACIRDSMAKVIYFNQDIRMFA